MFCWMEVGREREHLARKACGARSALSSTDVRASRSGGQDARAPTRDLLRNRNPPGPARFDSAVLSVGHDVVAKATRSIAAFLSDHHLVGRKKGHDNFAILRLTGNESRNVAVDGRFANCFADVRITIASHPLSVELDLQLIVTECEDAKVVAVRFVDAIDLSGRHDSARCLSKCES